MTLAKPEIQYQYRQDKVILEDWVEVPIPDPEQYITEDDTPVDNLLSEKQQRLLTTCLYSSLPDQQPFLAVANVGLYYKAHQPVIVPDVMVSFGLEAPEDWGKKGNRSYFVWNLGKPPDIVIEIVSNKVGNELGSKLEDYAQARVAYYVVFDPLQQLGETILQAYQLVGAVYQPLADLWFDPWPLGLTLWSGTFEDRTWDRWLRWCVREASPQENRQGQVLLTGDERAEQERQRAEQAQQQVEQERQRAEQAQQQVEQERQRAEQAQQQAEQERQRAEQERQRAERLAALLRAQGLDPDSFT